MPLRDAEIFQVPIPQFPERSCQSLAFGLLLSTEKMRLSVSLQSDCLKTSWPLSVNSTSTLDSPRALVPSYEAVGLHPLQHLGDGVQFAEEPAGDLGPVWPGPPCSR